MAEVSAKRVTGDEPQGTMGRVLPAFLCAHIFRETSGYEAVIALFPQSERVEQTEANHFFGIPRKSSSPPFQASILVAGERCNVTGEYFEKGSTSD